MEKQHTESYHESHTSQRNYYLNMWWTPYTLLQAVFCGKTGGVSQLLPAPAWPMGRIWLLQLVRSYLTNNFRRCYLFISYIFYLFSLFFLFFSWHSLFLLVGPDVVGSSIIQVHYVYLIWCGRSTPQIVHPFSLMYASFAAFKKISHVFCQHICATWSFCTFI